MQCKKCKGKIIHDSELGIYRCASCGKEYPTPKMIVNDMKCHLCDGRIWFWQKYKRRQLANAIIYAHFECWMMERIEVHDAFLKTIDDVIDGSKIRLEQCRQRYIAENHAPDEIGGTDEDSEGLGNGFSGSEGSES